MPEQYKAVVPARQGEEHPNEKLLKVSKKITDVVVHKIKGLTSNDPEYWGLADVISDEMLDIALKMKLRHHYTFSELVKLCEITKENEETFQKTLDAMAYLGFIEFDYGNHYDHNGRTAPQSERRYVLSMFVPGSAEVLNMEDIGGSMQKAGVNQRLKDHPELASFFERMTFIPLAGITQMVPPGGSGIGMHVIPVETAIPPREKTISVNKKIQMENETKDLEHLSYWLDKYEGHIGVGICSCRATRSVLEEGCADDEHYWCIGVGDFADYCRETGKGFDITKEEALQILKRGEDNGFVHQTTNIDGDNKIFGICNCNVNICNALRTSLLFNTPNLSRSAYTACVDPNNCVACGKCVEYCPAGAVKLGQKLCTKDGPVVYPWVDLPDAKKWTKDRWDEDYRDNNRKNCYDTGTAPCKTACPAHVAIQGYVKMAKDGRYEDALALIKQDNPFPAICGRVCNKKCEAACTRGTIDAPVSIDAIKKFIAAQDLNSETRYIPPVVVASGIRDSWDEKIAIIGAGPAGLSCAYYLATKGYKPTVFEKNARPGGMMTYGIPSYKLEKDVIEAEIDVLRALGVEIKCGVEVGKDVTIEQLKAEGYKGFYVAIGCQGGRRPGVANDNAEGTYIAVDFLKNAAENQNQRLEGEVVVVGGGNVAVDCARTAIRFGASKVSMYCLEDRATMPASLEEIKETLEENIAIENSWGPKEVKVDENGHVSGIVFKRCTRTIDPETKKFAPLYNEEETIEVPANHIVFAIGQSIVWGDLLKGSKVEFWHGNYPVADKLTYQTADPDIFVGGDVYTGPSFVVNAIEAGKCAAESLHRHVHAHASMTIGRNRRDFIELDKQNLAIESYDEAGRQEAAKVAGIEPLSFRDSNGTLTAEQVKTEASRCLSCGASYVDPHKCIGCGVCTTKCKFDAIHLKRDHPEATHYVKAEDKFKYILPYQLKRAAKILFHADDKETKEHNKLYKEFRNAYEARKAEEK